jgi:poly(A) polymerase
VQSVALDRIREATHGSKFENQLWLVGGAVRDELLGRPVSGDLDIVTELDAMELVAFLIQAGIVEGEPVTYARFGTAMIRVERSTIELVQARKESYDSQSRKPSVEQATLLDDAKRRDFTANTLLKNIHTGEPLDLLGRGKGDLTAKILRTPLDPKATFFDDPLRMLRAVRFKWKLGFEFADGLAEAIQEEVHRLNVVSAERIREEFEKILLGSNPDLALADLMDLGLLRQFLPEFVAMKGVDQGHFHHLDVWDHTLLVLKNASTNDLVLALGCLFHDIGKPATRSIDEQGATRFFSHETVGAEMAKQMLVRMKFSNSTAEEVSLLVKNHMRLGSWASPTPSAARRLVRDLGEHLDSLLDLIEADTKSLRPGVNVMDLASIKTLIEQVRTITPASELESPLSGEEIMAEMGLEPGPEVGKVKAWLLELVIEGELKPGDKEEARARLCSPPQ